MTSYKRGAPTHTDRPPEDESTWPEDRWLVIPVVMSDESVLWGTHYWYPVEGWGWPLTVHGTEHEADTALEWLRAVHDG